MLVRTFYLSGIWLILAFLGAMLWGTSVRRGGFFRSVLYLLVIIGLGDVVALWTTGQRQEIALISILVLWFGILLILLLRDWNPPGQAFFLFTLITSVLYVIYAFAITAFSPLTPLAFLFSFLLFLLEVAALTISLTYAFEVLDVMCRVRWRRVAQPVPLGEYVPMVSLHVPAYNEPPELVEQTLRALARLDYPRYEVIVVDNNTPEENVWQPIAEVCRELGFKCLHLEHWPGYKSGALNFALAVTDPQAEIVGVIDADYIVQPNYLKTIVPYFADQGIAFVQTPQDYRDYRGNRFFQAAYDGYKYFFAVSMPARNERNAIIFAGTMGLLRKQVLQEIGGWDEWCITEDAEASLRILNRGYKSLYVGRSFGRGLMPLNFEGLKKQRFRWAFGGVQILKKHWGRLMPWARWMDPHDQLTGAQRYFYLMAGLQWFNELLTFLFTVMVLISVFLTITGRTAFLRPTSEAFVILPIVLIGTNMLRALWGLRHALHITWKRAAYALSLWFGLAWVGTMACVQAVVRLRGVFLRTPKIGTKLAWLGALQTTSWETTFGMACVLGGIAVYLLSPAWTTAALMILCLSQATIYLSAPFQSLLSLESKAGRGAPVPSRADIRGTYVAESRVGLAFGVAALVMLLVALVASLWPQPKKLPDYAVLQPQPVLAPIFPTPIQVPVLAPPLPTPTSTPTPTPLPTGTARPSPTPTVTSTGLPTASSSPMASPSVMATPSPPPSVAPTLLPSPTLTPTPISPPTPTPLPPPTPVPQPTPLPPPTSPPTATLAPLPTAVPPTATATALVVVLSPTTCPTSTATATRSPFATPTPLPLGSPSPTPTPVC